MPGISFDNLIFSRTKINAMADPTNNKTHLQSCIRFASRFIKLRSPLKSSTMRQSTSFDILRHNESSKPSSTMMRAYSSPDFTRLHQDNKHPSDQNIFVKSTARRNSSALDHIKSSQSYISKSFISQPEEEDDTDDEEEERIIKYAKPTTAFLVSLSPSAAAAASAARYRRRRQVRVVSQGLVTLVS